MSDLDIALHAVRLYAETHPRPTHVSQTQAAEMLACSRWKITELLKAGTLRLNACGLIPIELVDTARSCRTVDQRHAGTGIERTATGLVHRIKG